MGEKTLNDIFYKPSIGASGAVEKGKFDVGLDDADVLIEANKDAKHTQGTDQGLDTGGANAVVVADIKDSVTKKHSQNTDTDLDATFEATFVKKTDKLSVMAATSSAELAGIISDETGTGKAVFGTLPTINKINLSEGQIIFPAVQVGSAGVNTLDDYEEGEWTADVTFGGAKVGITYLRHSGYYTKVGRKVTCNCVIQLTSKGTSIGSFKVSGLPFNCINNLRGLAPISLRTQFISFADMLQGYVKANSDDFDIWESTKAGAATRLTNDDFANNSYIIIGGTYVT